jgi:hypothetical protein
MLVLSVAPPSINKTVPVAGLSLVAGTTVVAKVTLWELSIVVAEACSEVLVDDLVVMTVTGDDVEAESLVLPL